jgi:hypothetical protein
VEWVQFESCWYIVILGQAWWDLGTAWDFCERYGQVGRPDSSHDSYVTIFYKKQFEITAI